jgi:hypothetical protein
MNPKSTFKNETGTPMFQTGTFQDDKPSMGYTDG